MGRSIRRVIRDVPVFVQLASFSTSSGKFDQKKDTKRLNEIMEKLQHEGARILDVKLTLSVGSAVYLVTYESAKPLAVE